MKRKILAVLSAAALTVSVAACGGEVDDDPGTTIPGVDGGTETTFSLPDTTPDAGGTDTTGMTDDTGVTDTSATDTTAGG